MRLEDIKKDMILKVWKQLNYPELTEENLKTISKSYNLPISTIKAILNKNNND